MSTPATPLKPIDQGDLVAFLVKLADFHATLSPSEQTILDDMTAKAMSPAAAESEVQGYALEFQGTPLTALGQAFASPDLAARSYYRPYRYYKY
jgi:hypothetical protein